MKRYLAVCIVSSGALATVASAAPVAGGQSPRSQLRGFVCQQSLDPGKRAMTVTAVMRPLPGTAKLAMRFELLRKSRRAARATSLDGRDLKTWITPADPTLGQRTGDVWIVHHPVVNLAAPDYYRFRVTYRWSAGDGHVLGTSVRVSRLCYQPELRPDLAVKKVKVTALGGGSAKYVALIANDGKTATGLFDVQLSLDGVLAGSQTAPALQPGMHETVRFDAPACTAGQSVAVAADPGLMVDDFQRPNNTLATSCPAS